MSNTNTEILEALVATYVAEEKAAGANLNNYLNNAAGIGEHPDIVEECKKLIKDIAEAREIIETVNSLVDEGSNNG